MWGDYLKQESLTRYEVQEMIHASVLWMEEVQEAVIGLDFSSLCADT